MQRKKNLKLLAIFLAAVSVTVVTSFFIAPENTIDVDRDIFAYENTMDIDRVVFIKKDTVVLKFADDDDSWSANGRYEADPQRITVLFAVLKQVSVRRRVTGSQADSLSHVFEEEGIDVSFYSDGKPVKALKVLGVKSQGLTYMMAGDEKTIYLVEIPGYKSYLAGIFETDINGWRNPLVFDLDWVNLANVSIKYPNAPDNDMHIVFDGKALSIKGMRADSSRLTDLVDHISLLYVNDYLRPDEVPRKTAPQCLIAIEDVGGRKHTLTVFQRLGNGDYLVRIDSADMAGIESKLIKRVTKPRDYFRPAKELP